MVLSRVNSPTLWGNVWLFVLRVLNIFRQKAQNASDVWTQYVQWEHVLAKYQLASAICCHEHMSARLVGRGEKICCLPGLEGTEPSRVSDNHSKHHQRAPTTLFSDWSSGSEMTENKTHIRPDNQERWATGNGFSVYSFCGWLFKTVGTKNNKKNPTTPNSVCLSEKGPKVGTNLTNSSVTFLVLCLNELCQEVRPVYWQKFCLL